MLGSLWTATKVTIGLLNEQAEASQDVVLRELTPNEIYKQYLFNQLNGNWKQYRLLSVIINCESGWDEMAYNVKSGDVGLFQISLKYHLENSIKLGYNIYEWKDNIGYAIYLYKHYETQPWNWSKSCWK